MSTPPPVIRRYLGLARPYRLRILLSSLLLIGSVVVRLMSPLVMSYIVDQVLIQGHTSRLFTLIALLMIFTLVPPILNAGANYLNAWVSQAIAADLRQQVFDSLLCQSMRFFDETKTGETVQDVMKQATGAALTGLGLNVPNIIREGFSLISVTIVLFLLDVRLALVTLLVFPLFFLPFHWMSRWAEVLGREYLSRRNALANLVQETISGIRLIVALQRQGQRSAALRASNQGLVRLWARVVTLDSLYELWFAHLLQAVGFAIVLGFGSFAVLSGDLTVGGLVAFMAYAPWLYTAISTLTQTRMDWAKNRADLERIFNYVDLKPDIMDSPQAVTLDRVHGQIEFEYVSFSYASRSESALHDLNLSIMPGQCVALVGPSGSGKSTVVDLLVRFYDPNAGTIRIDGHDIRHVTLASLRDHMGLVAQDTFLFNDTVLANLRFGNESASLVDIEAAAKASQIHTFIQSLPQGLDTMLGERGVKLSGGERQRIAIARALLRNPPILILDEATAAIDSVTEQKIQQVIAEMAGKRTVILIAHRLATVMHADWIYVFDHGRIIESDTHKNLLNRGGLYAQMYYAQTDNRESEPLV
ncbi:MAG: ABC transporter ATP-binding protein [Chloroflexi bacterium]|nr:ABC transporter ATP-binding protein [Chloroflexota bacterium]